MLSVAGEHLSSLNPQARLVMYGQELNPESYAICKADMLIKGQDVANIIFGNTLSADGLPGKHFDYMLSNPALRRRVEEDRKVHPQGGRADRATTAASAPACRGSATARCCSCCT
jgi:type I restriction-modification system DNA methylase subunit